MQQGVADECANAETKHQIDEVSVRIRVTESDDQQTTQRDDSDDKYGRCPVAVNCNVQTRFKLSNMQHTTRLITT